MFESLSLFNNNNWPDRAQIWQRNEEALGRLMFESLSLFNNNNNWPDHAQIWQHNEEALGRLVFESLSLFNNNNNWPDRAQIWQRNEEALGRLVFESLSSRCSPLTIWPYSFCPISQRRGEERYPDEANVVDSNTLIVIQ